MVKKKNNTNTVNTLILAFQISYSTIYANFYFDDIHRSVYMKIE